MNSNSTLPRFASFLTTQHNSTVPLPLFCATLLTALFGHCELVVRVFTSGVRWKMVALKFSRRVEWWHNMMYPVRRVWIGITTRIGIQKTGLLKLRHDVRACEYEDIRVMWEMLNRNESEFGHSPGKNKNRHYWKLFKWARCAPYICRS